MAARSLGPNQRLLELIGDVMGVLELEEFRHELVRAVRRAVPADWVSLNDIGPDPSSYVAISEPPVVPGLVEKFAELAYENPLVELYDQRLQGRVLRFSDLISQDELHSTRLYREVYRPLRVEYQIAFTLPHRADRILGVALSRGERDFGDEERDLLTLARPFLIQAYRNAIRYSAVLAGAPEADVPRLENLTDLGLTRRQAEVLQIASAGASDREIAQALRISVRTVQKHLERCYRLLGVDTRAEASALAWAAAGQPDGQPERSPRSRTKAMSSGASPARMSTGSP